MDLLNDITPFVNGGLSAFNTYIMFRILMIEKDVERERKSLSLFRENEQETNKELDNRLRKIEVELSKRWSTWRG